MRPENDVFAKYPFRTHLYQDGSSYIFITLAQNGILMGLTFTRVKAESYLT